MKNIPYLLAISFLLFGFNQIENSQTLYLKSNENISMVFPEDFYFEIHYGTNDSYNSKTEIYKRIYLDSTVSIKVELTRSEKEKIYNLFKKYRFNKLPNKITPKGNSFFVANHSFERQIIYFQNETAKSVVYDNTFFDEKGNKNLNHFLKIYNGIWENIKAKKEVQKLKESDVLNNL